MERNANSLRQMSGLKTKNNDGNKNLNFIPYPYFSISSPHTSFSRSDACSPSILFLSQIYTYKLKSFLVVIC